MNRNELEELVEKMGSLDIEADAKAFEYLLSEKVRAKMERVAKNLSKQSKLNLIIMLGKGSYSKFDKNIFICLDPLTTYYPGTTKEEMYLKLEGLLFHEVGHILYSDFNLFSEVCVAAQVARANIPNIARSVNKSEVDEPISEENKELVETMYDYIYHTNLKQMFNSIEDGGVENLVPVDYPKSYGAICSIRNHIIEKEEKEYLDKNYPTYKTNNENILEYFMTEIRHMCTIGYRRPATSTKFLSDIFNQDEIDDIERTAIYSRVATKSSAERLAISEIFLDKFSNFLHDKALEFYQRYMNAYNMDPEDIANLMDMEMEGHQELGINMPVDPSLAGHTTPQNITNDYQMDMPQDIQDKVNEKMKERQEKKEQENAGSDTGNGSESTSDADGTNESSEQNTTEQSNDASGNEEGTDESGESDDSTSTADTENTSGTEGESDNDGHSKSTGTEQEESETGNSSANESSPMKEGEVKSSAKDIKSMKAANEKDAETAVKESLSKIEKGLEKEEASDFKNSVGSSGSGVAPTLDGNLGDCESITDMHKGVKTYYYPSKKISGTSDAGKVVKNHIPELTKQANVFSKKLKEVLMYRAKARRKTALKKGKINDADLYRVMTDTRVFKDTIPGVIHKARICVLIDLSGSMYGEKEIDAISAAYMLADACQRVKVPISVLGHNTKGGGCSLYHFIEYEKCNKKEAREKLLAASADYANHDGLALFHSLTDLVRHKRKDEQLLMLVISDGAPAGVGNYWGEAADKDIRRIYKAFEKNYRTKTIGIGIGDDVAHVPEIYDNYLLVPDVRRLGNELLKVLKDVLL